MTTNLYIDNYIPAIKESRAVRTKYSINAYQGTVSKTPTNDSSATMRINISGKTAVDANNQATTSGIQITGNANGSVLGLQLWNGNAGALASGDIAVFSDTYDLVNGPYIDMGITSAAGNNPAYTVLPVGGYIFVLGYHFGLGTATAAKDVIIHAGGTLAANEVLRAKSTGPVLVQNATAVPAAGAATSYIGVSSTANFGVYWGSGAPTVSAAKGSLYLRTDGSGTGDRMYVNTNASTTWTAVTTAA